jgi:tetratricopeptide (TPR) repeat protein
MRASRPATTSKAQASPSKGRAKNEKHLNSFHFLLLAGAGGALIASAAIATLLLRPAERQSQPAVASATATQKESIEAKEASASIPANPRNTGDPTLIPVPRLDPDYLACDSASGDAAIAACTKAIASGNFTGADLAALYEYRGAAEDESDPNGALQDYNKAIELNPNLALAFNDRGLLFYNADEYDRALEDFNRAIELDSKFETAFDNRGVTYFAKNNADHALADYDHAIELNPDDLNAYWNRGDLYRSTGDREHAVGDYRKALSLGPTETDKKEIEGSLSALDTKEQPQSTKSSELGSQSNPKANSSQ